MISNGNVLKASLAICSRTRIVSDCSHFLNSPRVLLLKDLISNGRRKHMAGNVPSRSEKGSRKREKYEGCD